MKKKKAFKQHTKNNHTKINVSRTNTCRNADFIVHQTTKFNASTVLHRVADAQKRKSNATTRGYEFCLTAWENKRPEQDILSGVTWKRSMRSAFYWFAEFCHSQCLSHFAASFIVTRAEASIAKSCGFRIENFFKKILELKKGWNEAEVPTPAGDNNEPLHSEDSGSCGGSQILVLIWMCEWSFRRFTYGNLVTTSPSSKW